MSIRSSFINVPFENWLTRLFFEYAYLLKSNELNFLHGVKGSLSKKLSNEVKGMNILFDVATCSLILHTDVSQSHVSISRNKLCYHIFYFERGVMRGHIRRHSCIAFQNHMIFQVLKQLPLKLRKHDRIWHHRLWFLCSPMSTNVLVHCSLECSFEFSLYTWHKGVALYISEFVVYLAKCRWVRMQTRFHTFFKSDFHD